MSEVDEVKLPSSDEVGVAARNWQAFLRAYEAGHRRYVNEAKKFNRFYLGDQWEEELRSRLEREGRPALTINMVMPVVNAALGQHATQQVDLRFKPRRQADEETARVLTHVVDQILDANRYQAVEAQVFADGLVEDRGFFDVRVDFEHNLLGEVKITALDPIDVVIDPDAKEYDPDTWSEVFVTRWHTLNEIAALYGKEKAEELQLVIGAGQTFGSQSVMLASEERYSGDDMMAANWPVDELNAKNVKRVRVIERQWFQLDRTRVFVDLETGDMREVPENWSEERVNEVAAKYGLGITYKVKKRVRWTVTADHVVLHDDWSPYEHFTVVPYFPYFRRGKPSGLVRQLVSPQEQLNKVESQQLHVVNTTANSGWIVPSGALTNLTIDELEQRGAETGLVLEYQPNKGKPEKIMPNQIPSGLDRLGSKAAMYVQQISGVQALLGTLPKSEVSGVALERTQSQAMSQLQVVFDSLAHSRYLVARRILDCVQKFYNETRILKVTDWRQPEQPELEVVINQPTPTGEILNDVTIGDYDVIVSVAPARDGIEETQFAEAVQLRQAGVMIPDDVIIRTSHLANKDKIAERVARLQGIGDPTSEEAQLQQMQTQLALQKAMLELQELQAKIQELQSRAQLQGAKAAAQIVDAQMRPQDEATKMQMELEKLRQQMALKMQELRAKLELADKHIQAKNAQTIYQTTAKLRQMEVNNGRAAGRP